MLNNGKSLSVEWRDESWKLDEVFVESRQIRKMRELIRFVSTNFVRLIQNRVALLEDDRCC
jgi:hypothetical protein